MRFNKVAIYGATGLVGNYVLDELIHSSEVGQIISISRNPVGTGQQKVENYVCSAADFAAAIEHVKPDAVFCCLGTTRAKAGSKQAFALIDRDIPVAIAKASASVGVSTIAVVSSIGADAASRNFYLRTKGEMERDVLGSGVPNVVIVRPSLLLGPRHDFRFGEKIGEWLLKVADRFLTGKWKKYKAIHARSVAVAMLRLALKTSGKHIVESDQLVEIAKY
jgi:uncharacterized protein YbjT (DUF2867 family)